MFEPTGQHGVQGWLDSLLRPASKARWHCLPCIPTTLSSLPCTSERSRTALLAQLLLKALSVVLRGPGLEAMFRSPLLPVLWSHYLLPLFLPPVLPPLSHNFLYSVLELGVFSLEIGEDDSLLAFIHSFIHTCAYFHPLSYSMTHSCILWTEHLLCSRP